MTNTVSIPARPRETARLRFAKPRCLTLSRFDLRAALSFLASDLAMSFSAVRSRSKEPACTGFVLASCIDEGGVQRSRRGGFEWFGTIRKLE